MSKKDKTEDYRRLWRELLNQHPDASRQTIRHYDPRTYMYLYRHDRTWLMAHQPAVQESRSSRSSVDWYTRDETIAQEIYDVYQQLRTSPDRPVYLSVTALGRASGHLMLTQKHLNKLPKTATMLGECVETREAWAIRRIEWVVSQAIRDGHSLKRWEIIRLAGIGRLKNHPAISAYLDQCTA